MSDNNSAFRTVMRGYEPSEVDRRVAELTYATAAAQHQAAELQRQVDELTAAVEAAREAARNQPVPSTPEPVEANFANWIPTPTGLEIHFADYQFAHGLLVLTVPWSALDDVLAPGMAALRQP